MGLQRAILLEMRGGRSLAIPSDMECNIIIYLINLIFQCACKRHGELQREGSWFGKDSRSRTWADKDNQTKH